ncbi:kinase-like domain-containing protein [Fomes fomentarius]|nr:kinase-like domain-containing protein [Fomes fomentarius]
MRRSWSPITLQSKFALAQDSAGHDICVKIIKRDSDEYHINQYLMDKMKSQDADTFPFVLPPITILDPPYDFMFMISPLWGDDCDPGRSTNVRQILVFVRCMLTGLSFLHAHRIAHRDISDRNILTNGYCPDVDDTDARNISRAHSCTPSASFCLIDFDLAIQLPRDVSVKGCRRPSHEAFCGSAQYHPSDCSLGEPEYNPFAFDVGCLGMLFIYHFAEAFPKVPCLAALCAKMTTYVVEERFTAAEALSFYNDHMSGLPDEQLHSTVILDPSLEPLRNPELYWRLLIPEDRHAWTAFRAPQESWGRRILRWMADTEIGWQVLRFMRGTLRI